MSYYNANCKFHWQNVLSTFQELQGSQNGQAILVEEKN